MLLRVYVSSVGKTNATQTVRQRGSIPRLRIVSVVDGYALGQATYQRNLP